MPAKKTATKKSIESKDDIIHTVTHYLLNGLTILKEQLGEKKYEKRVKKAAKLLVEGVKKNQAKNTMAKPEKESKPKNATANKETEINAKPKGEPKIPSISNVKKLQKVKTKKERL